MRSHVIAGLNQGTINYIPPTLDENAGAYGGINLDDDEITETSEISVDGAADPKPSVRHNSYNLEDVAADVVSIARVGAAVQQTKGERIHGINWSTTFALMGAGAALGGEVGAVIGGQGAVIGALIGAVVGAIAGIIIGLMDQHTWNTETADARHWITNYCPQEYADLLASDYGEQRYLIKTDALTIGLMGFWLERYGVVVTDNSATTPYGIPGAAYYTMYGNYAGGKAIYEPLGIDYGLTRLEQAPAGTTSNYDGTLRTSLGLGGVWILKANQFRYAPGDTNQDGVVDANDESDGGSSMAGAAPLLLLGAALLLGGKPTKPRRKR